MKTNGKGKRYFTEWEGKPLEEVFRLCRELAEDPTFPTVKAWRADGGKVVGHFQVYFPEEIAAAGGMLPVKVRGAQTDGLESGSRFGSYLCSIIKSSLDAALIGDLELELFVSHPICDAARNLAAVWDRNFDYGSQILYLPQNPNSRMAVEYLTFEYGRLQRSIEAIGGMKIGDKALREEIAVYNHSRHLMRRLYQIRRETPWLLSADESMALIAVAGLIPRAEYNALLEAVLPLVEGRPGKKLDKMRVVFEGGFCETPPIDLLQTISRSCYVVDDDLFIGLRYIVEDVADTGAPLHDLAEAYIEKSTYSPVQHDKRKPKEDELLKRVEASGAEAVVLGAAKMCEPGLDEQVAYSQALGERKIPHFISEFEENQTTFDHLAIQLETFVENIMFD